MAVPRKHVSEPYYSFLTVVDPSTGRPKKIKEGRVCSGTNMDPSEFWNDSLIGKDIEFYKDANNRAVFRVVGVTYYLADPDLPGENGIALRNAIYKMLKSEGVSNMLPDINDIRKGVDKYMSFNQDKLSARVIGAFEVVLL